MLPIGILARPSGTWELVGQSTLTAAASSISFPVLPVYRALWVEVHVTNDANAKAILLRFNGDSGANYTTQDVSAIDYTVAAGRTTQTSINLDSGANLDASEIASLTLLIVKPAASSKAQVLSMTGINASPGLFLNGSEWNNTSALITSFTLTASAGNFAVNTSVRSFGSRRMDA